MLFLAGDIGGTKALLQLIEYDLESSNTTTLGQQRYLCQDFDSLESIIHAFLSFSLSSYHSTSSSSAQIELACFGLPGPVDSRLVQLTNLPWVVDALSIENNCSIRSVNLVNDFYAAALGVNALTHEDFFPLYTPEGQAKLQSVMPDDHCLVVGAGTGLGVAPVFFDGQRYCPVSSEGGHFDFAPISETQQCLLRWLWNQWEHVSYERVLSGPGLETLYRFFQTFDGPVTYADTCSGAGLRKASQNSNKNEPFDTQNNLYSSMVTDMLLESGLKSLTAEEIYQAAEQGEPVAVKALTEFVTIYGAFVGAVSLIWKAPRGIYLAGGIALKLIHWLEKPYFQKAFLEKGRMSKVVSKMPIYIVVDEVLGLKGAMQHNFVVWKNRKEDI